MEQIEQLFNQYITSNSDKKLNKEKIKVSKSEYAYNIWGCNTMQPSTKAEYDHDGVYIYYHSRVTTVLGDTDTFYDKIVKLNGEILLNKIKC